jgi:hypothetical protein
LCPRTSWTDGSGSPRSGPRRTPPTSKASTFEGKGIELLLLIMIHALGFDWCEFFQLDFLFCCVISLLFNACIIAVKFRQVPPVLSGRDLKGLKECNQVSCNSR